MASSKKVRFAVDDSPLKSTLTKSTPRRPSKTSAKPSKEPRYELRRTKREEYFGLEKVTTWSDTYRYWR
jgi:hypothetical protein